jgi:hypothetical protein
MTPEIVYAPQQQPHSFVAAPAELAEAVASIPSEILREVFDRSWAGTTRVPVPKFTVKEARARLLRECAKAQKEGGREFVLPLADAAPLLPDVKNARTLLYAIESGLYADRVRRLKPDGRLALAFDASQVPRRWRIRFGRDWLPDPRLALLGAQL